jgi:hypothetical protein
MGLVAAGTPTAGSMHRMTHKLGWPTRFTFAASGGDGSSWPSACPRALPQTHWCAGSESSWRRIRTLALLEKGGPSDGH